MHLTVARALGLRRHLPAGLAALALVAVTGCGDDGGPTIDAAPSAVDAAAVDAAAIDAQPVDARVDAIVAIDAAPPAALNGCTAAAAIDRTAVGASRNITFPGFAYAPPCMKIRVGQAVTWSGDLGFHPLRAGAIVGGVATAQPGNPVPSISTGNTATATFGAAGDYGYYCANHFAGGMVGAIFVVP